IERDWRALPPTGRLKLKPEIGPAVFALAESACEAEWLHWHGEQADGLAINRRGIVIETNGVDDDVTVGLVLVGMPALVEAYGRRDGVSDSLLHRDLRLLAAAPCERQPGLDRFPVRSADGHGAWICCTDGLFVTAYDFALLS